MNLRALSLAALAVFPVGTWLNAAEKTYTQVPEIAPAVGVPMPEPKAQAGKPLDLQAGPAPKWIWGADQNKKYVARKTFTADGAAGRLAASCDNVVMISLNGHKLGTSTEWNSPVEVDVTKHLKAGENVLEATVQNEGGPAGFVAKLAYESKDGKTAYVVTDDTWQVATSADAKQWDKVKVVATYGDQPWGKVFAGGGDSGERRDLFNVPPGFQVERLFTVPKDELGSWVNIVCDSKGRLIVSDQGNLGLCRVTPPPIGSSEPTKVERLNVKMSGAQGFLFAFDSLYVCANGGPGSGLWRLRDTNGDDQFDEVVKLKDIRGGGEHGPHALRLSPDGKSIYVCCGNHTQPPFDRKLNAPPQTMGGPRAEQLHAELPEGAASRLAPVWDEDLLLPRQWDSNGHAAGILAPGGWVAKTDPEGKTWEIVSSGYRNEFDFAFNADGEMFVYDADMEWDMGSPWYRPTRVSHSPSGSEFGWRSGTGKWPEYYVDSLPACVDIGPGSPVGVDFGYGTKFPAKYQKALFICDWTFGTMYAIHTEPDGASYKAVKEEFVSRSPLPLTDCIVGKDGALYFTVGGRGTQSELYRVTYVGKESTAPVDAHDSRQADLRKLRHEIEAYHRANVENPQAAAKFLLPHLSHADRHIRYATRVALERLPLSVWQDAVLNSKDAETVITGCVGLARMADHPLQARVIESLDGVDYHKLTEAQQLEYLRAWQLVFIRMGAIDEATQARLGSKFEGLYPGKSESHNRELAILMVFLQSPRAAQLLVPVLTRERVMPQVQLGDVLSRNKGYGGSIASMMANHPDLEQTQTAFTLRNLKKGWTPALRKIYFGWFEKAHTWSGGNSYQKFLTNIENDAFDNSTDNDRLAIEAMGLRKPYVPPPLPKPQGPGRTYTLDEVLALANGKMMKGRNFKNGKTAFAAARCVVCHRFAGDGGATGPDLTQAAGRFGLKDLTEAIIDPSKVISDQYKATVVVTKEGKQITGRIVSDAGDSITMVIDPESSAKTVMIPKKDIEEQLASPASLMPKDLLNVLNENEVLDLLAYVLSRGNEKDPMFHK
ncbi:MAG TPA: c-type cytochrome [Planctomycetaceae bacterium]|nr:c-type cytochrome [Planctomycetaceae bacterium]